MSDVNTQDDLRELTLAELAEIAGGSYNINFAVALSNLGIGQINQDSLAVDNVNIGVGQVNIDD